MRVIYFTNNGKVRSNNEDGLLVGDHVIIETMDTSVEEEGSYSLLCVADGMGGSEYGELATKAFLSSLATLNIEVQEDVLAAVKKTQKEIQGIDTGCAFAGIVIGENAFVFNIGDCRVYKKEDIFLNKLTKDHSIVQALIDRGEISEEEALVHPKKHILTSALTPTSEVETYTKKISLLAGSIYLVCSDGLWGEFGIEELEDVFNDDNIEKINENISQAIQDKKLEDNISYILLEV